MNEIKYKYLNDDTIYKEKQSYSKRFLYHTILGRLLLKLIIRTSISNIVGFYLNSKYSRPIIKKYINKNSIKMDLYEDKKYQSFNDFFIRKRKEIKKTNQKKDFISTANSRITSYKITNDLKLYIKNSTYSLQELVKDDKLCQEYKDGIVLVYRLSPSDYHHYIYCDNGKVLFHKKIKGVLHTVNPIAFDKYKVFSENTREVMLLKTENFGEIIQIEVGALLVGKIENEKNKIFKRYDEKGHFEFGGSTIIQLLKKNAIKLNSEILNNSINDIETYIEIGDVIGNK